VAFSGYDTTRNGGIKQWTQLHRRAGGYVWKRNEGLKTPMPQ
jgi:hypothetical protein